ncbi:N-acetylmuramoyl-L-alanine amidase [Paenibacillus amylolyticus]|uniref:N-acetylmuramoyl-L-alanine amidase n=1 Tax=Paenibacillus amylolyticus TaxID=1451 RepID=UPI003D95F057
MKKSIILFLFSMLLLMLIPMHTHAASHQTKIILDGQELVLPNDVEVVNVRSNIMIPIRVVAENLKFNVKWNQKTQNVNIEQASTAISLTVGKDQATVQNNTVQLNIAPQMIKNTVVVPLRFVSEEMGLRVGWNNKDKIVTLTSNNGSQPASPSHGNDAATNLVHDITYANNQLVVSLDREVAPVISTLKNPERIIVDFPSTNFGNMGQVPSGGSMGRLDVNEFPSVTDIRYSLFKNDPPQVRIVIELNNISSVNYTQQTIAGKFILDLSMANEPAPAPATPVNSGKKIVVIDPGHGGSDPGTISYTKQPEKHFALALGLKVQALLENEPDIELMMTRETDVYPTRPERVKLANDLNADVFVSIHGNSVPAAPQISGTETYYYQRESSKALATLIHKNLIDALGFNDRGVKNGNYQVIRETTMSAVLLEIGFLSNQIEEEAMMSETNLNKAAQAIVDGIKEYLKL